MLYIIITEVLYSTPLKQSTQECSWHNLVISTPIFILNQFCHTSPF